MRVLASFFRPPDAQVEFPNSRYLLQHHLQLYAPHEELSFRDLYLCGACCCTGRFLSKPAVPIRCSGSLPSRTRCERLIRTIDDLVYVRAASLRQWFVAALRYWGTPLLERAHSLRKAARSRTDQARANNGSLPDSYLYSDFHTGSEYSADEGSEGDDSVVLHVNLYSDGVESRGA